MARSAEKKMTALARWRAACENKITFSQRPKLASECMSLRDANTFRRQIISDISRKIAQIQNSSLDEFRLRDLNDEINHLFREKRHWEDRIVELGGTDHRIMPSTMENEGKCLPGNWGYRYFGAARDLPGVRELFQSEPEPVDRRVRKDLSDYYYGYQDEADGVVLPIEAEQEHFYRQELFKTWSRKMSADAKQGSEVEDDIYRVDYNPADEELNKMATGNSDNVIDDYGHSGILTDLEARVSRFTNVSVPTQEDVERTVLQLKKNQILNNYMTEELMTDMVSCSTLLGTNKNDGS